MSHSGFALRADGCRAATYCKNAQNQAENPSDETISRNPRNHPETDGAYISGHQMAHRRLGGIT
jgi:hypothetical protein